MKTLVDRTSEVGDSWFTPRDLGWTMEWKRAFERGDVAEPYEKMVQHIQPRCEWFPSEQWLSQGRCAAPSPLWYRRSGNEMPPGTLVWSSDLGSAETGLRSWYLLTEAMGCITSWDLPWGWEGQADRFLSYWISYLLLICGCLVGILCIPENLS